MTKADIIREMEPFPDTMPIRTLDNPKPVLTEIPWTDPSAEDDQNYLLLA